MIKLVSEITPTNLSVYICLSIYTDILVGILGGIKMIRTATLDFQQVLSFTSLSESTVKAKGQKTILKKLSDMGVFN